MKSLSSSLLLCRCLLLLPVVLAAGSASGSIPVVVSPDALPVVTLAAEDLAHDLGRIYPGDTFAVVHELPGTGMAVLVGTLADAQVRQRAGHASPTSPESYVVRVANENGRQIGIIAGYDGRGASYGVYALLEKLGCGFYLSYDAIPPAGTEPFSLSGWSLENAPLVAERIVFDWHNFLSGCSTWNLEDWKRWTAQSQKMGYNAIMVHAYGNNPMTSFTFHGIPRPVGFLSTTIKGRDWDTMHVNDVRRLFGGELFSRPAFGAEAAFVPDDQRVRAAQSLMEEVFADAAQRDMGVYFAVDVDTPSAIPQEFVKLLPESARFEIVTTWGGATNRFWLPIADTPEGYAFYREEVEQLMKCYPQITKLVLWFRDQSTPVMALAASDLPAAWQKEFAAEIQHTPGREKLWRAPGMFAVGKILRAFDRALKDCGATHTTLAVGTWNFDFLPSADHFLPAGVPLIGLDYDVPPGDNSHLNTAERRAPLRAIGAHRPLIIVFRSQHDDGHYIGRSYTPLPELASKLEDAKVAGFGILHWNTRPLDLYFESVAKQVWKGTKDQPLSQTCRDFAESSFGSRNREIMGAYLEVWITGAPQFGRETGDFFFDHPLTNIDEVVGGCRSRLAMIRKAQRSNLSAAQTQCLDYWRALEEFIAGIYVTQGFIQDAQELMDKGEWNNARQLIAQCHPENVIGQFARLGSNACVTRGEQGLAITLNTRWLTHFIACRQALGLEPVRVNFAPTSHDRLAQSPGIYTLYVDSNRDFWETWGEKETGASVSSFPPLRDDATAEAWREIARSGIQTGKPLTLALQPLMAVDSRHQKKTVQLLPGQYRVRLLTLDPDSTAPGQRIFDVKVADTPAERVDVFQRAGGAGRLVVLEYEATLKSPGTIDVTLTPVKGSAILCAAILSRLP